SKHSCGKATGAKTPAVRATSEGDQRGESHAKNLKQRGDCGGVAVKSKFAKKQRLGCNPIPIFSRHRENVARAPNESLPCKSANEVGQAGNGESAKRGHHPVARPGRTSPAHNPYATPP